MDAFICTTCGTQFAPAPAAPAACPICRDERQYVGPLGQRWTTLDALRRGHANTWRLMQPDLFAVRTQPAFAIGQRAFLVRSPGGNVLWDCLSLIDNATVALVQALGGVAAIAISHPHYYATMADWAAAFGAPVHLHEADRADVMRPGPHLRFWSGATHALHDGMTLIHAPGHFAGATMLHWPQGAGVLLSGDIVQVAPDTRWASFLYSYPNMIPLSERAVRGIVAAVEPFAFDRVYGAFEHREIMQDGKAAVRRSAERYIGHLHG